MRQEKSLRGCMIGMWQRAGSKAAVPYEQAFEWAHDCDRDLRELNVNPAPEFRDHLEREDRPYLRTYLRGCRFPFRLVEDAASMESVREMARSGGMTPFDGMGWRSCLKCGRLNLMDAVYCSYCGKNMPRDTEQG